MKTDLCILAAGFSSRFHGNKLLTEYDGKTMIEHLLHRIDASVFENVYVVTQYERIQTISKSCGFIPIQNPHPEWGLSSSIHCGIQACTSDQIVFLVADQPRIQMDTLYRLLDQSDGIHIVSSSVQGTLRNPMLFPRSFFSELFALKGDQGAKHVALRHLCRCIEVNPEELVDVDTNAALASLCSLNVERKDK